MQIDPRKLDADSLADQTRSLRALARRLVGDEHRACDVVQQAWLTALEKPPRSGFTLGGWLAGITRNHARDAKRAERRRAAHETRAAAPDRTPEDDAIERLDTIRDLLAHVRELDEPYRSTITRRFLDGLAIRAIARQDGVPSSTVRTRLSRGIERLRERLDRAHGGDRRAWIVSLVPIAAGHHGALPMPIADGLSHVARAIGLGALGMSMKTKLLSLVAVLLAALAILFTTMNPFDPASANPNGSPDPVVADRTATLDPTPAEGNTDPETQRTDVEDDDEPLRPLANVPRCVVTGSVRDEHGTPIAHATIQAHGEPHETDANGEYTIDFPMVPVERWLSASAPEHASKRRIVQIGDTERIRVDFVLPRGFVIEGRVTDSNGDPVVGAEVETFYASDHGVKTDEHGRYRLDRLDPGRPSHALRARSSGYLDASAEITTAGASVTKDLVLARGARVHGRVLDPVRAPIDRAAMFIGFSPNDYDKLEAVSAPDGSFEFPAVQPGSRTLVTRIEGFAPRILKIDVPSAGETLEVDVELERGRSLRGVVTDGNARPLKNVSVSIRSNGMYIGRRADCDELGRFELEGLPTTPVDLEVYGTGFVRQTLRDIPATRTDVSITMQRTFRIAGTVVDRATGVPVDAFVVRFIRPELRDGEQSVGGYSATWMREGRSFANEDGTWDTGRETLAPGFITGLEVHADGYAPTVVPRVVASHDAKPADLRIELDRGVRLSGIVTDTTGRAVDDCLIKVVLPHAPLEGHSDDTHARPMTRSDSRGAFTFEDIAPGAMHLAVEHAEFGLSLHAIEVAAGAEHLDVAIHLVENGSIEGRVLDMNGAGVADATVRVSAVDVPGLESREWVVTTARDGRFAVGHLPDGVYRIARTTTVEMAWTHHVEIATRYVVLEQRSRRTVDLREPTTGTTLEGTIAEPTPSRAIVKLQSSQYVADWESRFATRAAVATNGSFVFRGVPPGTYRLHVSWNGTDNQWVSRAQSVEIAADATMVRVEIDE